MQVKDKVLVVTGGAEGIGLALCRRFAAEGARVVAVVDLNADGATQLAAEIGGMPIAADVSREADVAAAVQLVTERYDGIDLFCSNAGIIIEGGLDVPDDQWQNIWGVNVLAHLYAARAVVPAMLARGSGYLLQTVSAAGLLSQIGSAPYAVTKHAALALAEWLSITYGDQGLRVSVLCPQGVRTNMLLRPRPGGESFLMATAIEPEAVAQTAIEGLADERFLILPHPEVAEYFRRKASDYNRWLRGMRRLQASVR